MSSKRKYEYRVIEEFDAQARLISRSYYQKSVFRPYRVGGPALQKFDPETGKRIEQCWFEQTGATQCRMAENQPSMIVIDPTTDVTTSELYFGKNGRNRTDGGPAEIHRAAQTGKVVREVYCVNGVEHRDGDLPAIIEYDPVTGGVRREEFYRDWERHRDNGAAVIVYDDNEKPIADSLQYFQHGTRVMLQQAYKPEMP